MTPPKEHWIVALIKTILAIFRPAGTPPPTTPPTIPPIPTTPPVPDDGRIKFPTGPIKTKGPKGQNLGSWDDIARWEPWFTEGVKAAGSKFGPLLLACFAVVESGGNHYRTGKMTGTGAEVVTGGGNPPSKGILQVVCGLHAGQIPTMNCLEPKGNIFIAAKLLTQWMASEGSWEAALTNKYHPGTDPKSGYTPQTYIETVRKLIAEVKGIQPPVVAPKNPYPRPVIYDLVNDGARFGITTAEAMETRNNCNKGRNGRKPEAIVLHTQSGHTAGSLDWWLYGYVNGVKVRASASRMIQKDGSVLIVIPDEDGPWTNGQVCRPTAKSGELRQKCPGDVNNCSLTIEAEGDTNVAYTQAQFVAILWQCAEWLLTPENDLTLSDLISHASIDQCDRPHCPGDAHMNAVVDRLRADGFK